jgi:hypothetical protein
MIDEKLKLLDQKGNFEIEIIAPRAQHLSVSKFALSLIYEAKQKDRASYKAAYVALYELADIWGEKMLDRGTETVRTLIASLAAFNGWNRKKTSRIYHSLVDIGVISMEGQERLKNGKFSTVKIRILRDQDITIGGDRESKMLMAEIPIQSQDIANLDELYEHRESKTPILINSIYKEDTPIVSTAKKDELPVLTDTGINLSKSLARCRAFVAKWDVLSGTNHTRTLSKAIQILFAKQVEDGKTLEDMIAATEKKSKSIYYRRMTIYTFLSQTDTRGNPVDRIDMLLNYDLSGEQTSSSNGDSEPTNFNHLESL